MIERIVDWQKAINLAAKRFRDIVTACNEADSEKLEALVISGLGTEEDYTSSPENVFKLDEKGCFIYKGFVCQICDCYELHKSADDGASFYACRVAVHTAIDKHLKWIIVPYILYEIPSDSYMDKCTGLLNAIDEVTVGMEPELYEEIEKYELV